MHTTTTALTATTRTALVIVTAMTALLLAASASSAFVLPGGAFIQIDFANNVLHWLSQPVEIVPVGAGPGGYLVGL